MNTRAKPGVLSPGPSQCARISAGWAASDCAVATRRRDDQIRHPENTTTLEGVSVLATNAASLLNLPADAVEYVPPPPKFQGQPAGKAQAFVAEYGRGRVVILGEAAMLTAQVDKGHRFGMNLPGADNRQLTLNVMHWLSRLL